MLSPLLYSLFTQDFLATHASNSTIKFADDTTVVGRITNNDEFGYIEEVRALVEWYQENNLSLNVNKMKALIVDFMKQQREHAPIHIDGTAVGKVESFKFLNVHITDHLKWSTHRQCGEEGATAALQTQEGEEIAVCPKHHRWHTVPPGHLQNPMSQES
jgi:hypothetical protein